MTPKTQSGTIAIDPSTSPVLGQPLLFDYTAEGLKGNQHPRIEIVAYQDVDGDGEIDDPVYTAAGPADGSGITTQPFTLGGTSSEWLLRGGPAHCVAKLYYWDFHPVQTFVELARMEFDAAGG